MQVVRLYRYKYIYTLNKQGFLRRAISMLLMLIEILKSGYQDVK